MMLSLLLSVGVGVGGRVSSLYGFLVGLALRASLSGRVPAWVGAGRCWRRGCGLGLVGMALCSAVWADETVVVTARGQGSGGVWPAMQVWVNGVKISGSTDVTVGDANPPEQNGSAVYSSYADYTFTSPTTPAGAPRLVVDIAFTNDANLNGQDRNLLISAVTVRGQTLRGSDPGALIFKNVMPDNLGSAADIVGGNGGNIAWMGTLRLSTQNVLAGTCAGATHSTIAAAIAAAQTGDTIPICTGTYNEALTIDKSLGLVAASGINDVNINGGSAPAITLAADTRLTNLRLMHLKLLSTAQGLLAGATSTPLLFTFYNLNASTTGTSLDFSNGNLANGSALNSDSSGNLTSTAGSAMVLNSPANYAVSINNTKLVSKRSALIINGPGSSPRRHGLGNLNIDTTSGDSNAHGIEVHSGTATVTDSTVRAAGRGLSFDGSPNLQVSVDRLNAYTVGDGINVGPGYNSASLFNSFANTLIQTSGAGSRGIVNYGGYYYSNLTIKSDGDAINSTVYNQAQLSFTNLSLTSTSGAGINLPGFSNGSGNSIVIGGDVSAKVVISAKTTGINLNASGVASYTLAINNVTIDGAQAGIVTGASLGHTLSLGSVGPVVVNTPSTSNGAWALDLAKVTAPSLQNLTVSSVNGGIHLGSGVTGNVSLQGTANAPLSVTATGASTHALRLDNSSASNTVSLNYINLKAPAGYALQAAASVNLSSLANFDIQSWGDGVYLANQPGALSISNGTVRATQAGANGLYLAAGSTCNQSKSISNVTSTAGDGGIALYVGCASTVNVSGSCLRNGATGLGLGSASGRITVTGTATNGATYLGLNLGSNTSGGSVSGSCFAANTTPPAQSTSGQTFSGNYWQGNSASVYSSGNISDSSALASCPLAASLCPVSGSTTRLLAAYDFEESSAWTGATGEIKDSAGAPGGPYNGQLYVVGGASTAPVQASTSPARSGSPGTCSYAQLKAGGAFTLPNLPTNTNSGNKTTVSFWMKWNGVDAAMAIGWRSYDLWFRSDGFGFNTGMSDIYGVPSASLLNTWRHVVAVFHNGDVGQSVLYIDGVAQTLTQRLGVPSQSNAFVSDTLRVGGWTANDTYINFPGSIDQVRVYDGDLSAAQARALYNETHPCGGQLVAQYHFEDSTAYAGVAGELADSAGYSGGPYPGKAIGQPVPSQSSLAPARTGVSGTCAYARFSGPLVGGGAFDISGLPVSTAPGAKTSVAFWMYWDGVSGVRPIGWHQYDLWLATNAFGFNTSNNDVHGVVPTGLSSSWHHIVAVFTNGDVGQNELYIDGIKQSLSALQSAPSASNAVVQSALRVGGWGNNNDFRFSGYLDELKVFNGALTAAQVLSLYNEVHPCSSTGPVAEWRMDELTWASAGEVQVSGSSTYWRGDVGAVLDSGPYGLHGTAQRSSGGTLPVPTASGKVCGAGDFSGSYNAVAVGNDITDRLSSAVTIMGWVKQPRAATYNYLFSNARDCCGSYRGINLAASYATQTVAQIWNANQALSNASAGNAVPLGVWTHVATTFDGSLLKLYVNGVLKSSVTFSSPVSIGSPASWPGVIGALANCPTCDANMLIDELKIWNRAISASELTAIYNNENSGLSWDGSTRDCGNQAPVSDWHYDEFYWTGASNEIKDSSSSVNHAQALNGAASSAVGKVCRAGSFSGVSGDGLQDGVQAGIPLGGLSSKVLSTSMWVRFNTLANEQLMMYIGFNSSSTSTANRFFYLSTFRSDGLGWDGLHFGVTNVNATWGRAATVNSSLFQTGVWQHVVTVNDLRSGRLTAYINGNRVYDAITPAGSIPGTPTVVYVGYTPEGGRVTNALFDEVLLFNGALSAAQVQAIYSNQAAGKNWDGSARVCPSTPGAPALLNAFDTGTAAGAVSGYVTTKVAGNAVTVDVVALDATKTAVDTGFNQTVKVELVANAALGVDVDSANCPLSSTVLGSAKLAVINGRSTVTLPVVANVWRDARIRLTFPATGTASIVACSNDNFALRPWALGLVARDADWQTAGGARTLDAATESASPTHKAGQPFSLVVSAYDNGGALSTNYAGTPSVASATCSLPSAGCVGGLLQPGNFTGGGGTVTSNTAAYSEVGVIKVQLQDDTFAQVDGTDGSSSTERTALSPLVTVGRFVPDHFSVLPVSVTPGCSLGSSPFTYLGQDSLVTVATLIAQNAQGLTTQNYSGTLARLDLSQYANQGFAALNLPSGSVLGSGAQAPTGLWSQGVALLTRAYHLISKPAVPVAPASITLTTRPVDLDGITVPAAVTLASAQRYVHGRLKLGHAFGAPSTDLVLPLSAQFWDGSRFVTNSADSCTGFDRSAVGFRSFTSDLAAVETGTSHLVGNSWQLSSGVASLRVSRPRGGDGKYRGSSDLFLNLGSDAVCSNGSSTAAVGLGHLQGSWSWSGGVCSNPVGRMTYGADRQTWVFRREMY